MKKYFYIAITILSITLISLQFSKSKISHQHEIQFFEGSLEEAKSLAQKESKVIFIDVYAVWCGPCKTLKNKTFTDEIVADYFNENFINLSLDGEKPEGIAFASKYPVRAYPSLFFMDANGMILNKSMGYMTSKQLMEFAYTIQKNEK
jgi:thioredoxin 1